MKLLKGLQKAALAVIGPRPPEDLPVRQSTPPPARGVYRFGLLMLVAVVVLINVPFIIRHYMPGHDSKSVLGVFDYIYSNWLFAGELPHWMVYGLHGLDAAAFQLADLSAASYLVIFCGKLFGVKDSLALFSASLCLEQLLFLLGFYLLSRRLFQERLTLFCICLTAVGLVSWQTQLSLTCACSVCCRWLSTSFCASGMTERVTAAGWRESWPSWDRKVFFMLMCFGRYC